MAPGLYRAMAASVLSVGKGFPPLLSTPSRGKVIEAVKSPRATAQSYRPSQMPTPNAHAATNNAMIHPYCRRENFIAPTHDSVSSALVRLSGITCRVPAHTHTTPTERASQ